MSKLSKLNALAASVVVGALGASVAQADANPFSASDVASGYLQLAEGKCGEGKCGEGKCGESKDEGKDAEGKCGGAKDDGKAGEGKCGEGKCGDKK